jgi:hypothetical protein
LHKSKVFIEHQVNHKKQLVIQDIEKNFWNIFQTFFFKQFVKQPLISALCIYKMIAFAYLALGSSALFLRGQPISPSVELGVSIGENLAKSLEEAFDGSDDFLSPSSHYANLKKAIVSEYKPLASKEVEEAMQSTSRLIKEALSPSQIVAGPRAGTGPESEDSAARNQYFGPGGPVVGM